MSDVLISKNCEYDRVEFEFDTLTDRDIQDLIKSSKTFSVSLKSLREQNVVENRFDTEHGSSQQKITIYLHVTSQSSDRQYVAIEEVLDIDNLKIKLSEKESGYYSFNAILDALEAKQMEVEAFTVLTRTLSNYVLDKHNFQVSCVTYLICDDIIGGILERNPSLGGFLATKGIGVRSLEDARSKLKLGYNMGDIKKYYYEKYLGLLENVSNL